LADKSEHLQACMAYRIAAGLYSQEDQPWAVKVMEGLACVQEILGEMAGK